MTTEHSTRLPSGSLRCMFKRGNYQCIRPRRRQSPIVCQYHDKTRRCLHHGCEAQRLAGKMHCWWHTAPSPVVYKKIESPLP